MIATRIPKSVLDALGGEKPSAIGTDVREGARKVREGARATSRVARPWKAPQPIRTPAKMPLDQVLASYPLWWARWALLKLSWLLGLLNWPAYLAYQAAWKVNWVGANYGKVRSFAIAHAAGPVRRKTWRARARNCKGCKFHYKSKDGTRFCRGDNGGRGCGCGHWRLARLVNKLALSGWQCPVGKFGYGLIGRLQRMGARDGEYMDRRIN